MALNFFGIVSRFRGCGSAVFGFGLRIPGQSQSFLLCLIAHPVPYAPFRSLDSCLKRTLLNVLNAYQLSEMSFGVPEITLVFPFQWLACWRSGPLVPRTLI